MAVKIKTGLQQAKTELNQRGKMLTPNAILNNPVYSKGVSASKELFHGKD